MYMYMERKHIHTRETKDIKSPRTREELKIT